MTAVKEIATRLDMIAAKTEWPASPKQIWFLATLISAAGDDAKRAGFDICNSNARLTKKSASFAIENYLRAKRAA